MGKNDNVAVLFPIGSKVFAGEFFVDFTMTLPEDHLHFGLTCDITPKELIRQEYDPIGIQ